MVVICSIKDSFCLNISVFLIDKGFNMFLSDANIFRIDGESVSYLFIFCLEFYCTGKRMCAISGLLVLKCVK